MNKLESYLNEIYIQEDMKEALKEFSNLDMNFMRKVKSALNPTDPKGSLKKVAKFVPPGINAKKAMSKIDSVIGLKISEYPRLKKRATAVVKNSVNGASKQMAEVAGTYLAFSSLFVKKGQENTTLDKNLKVNLKIFVGKVRKFGEDYEDEDDQKNKKTLRPGDLADLSIAWVVCVMSAGLAVGIGAGLYVAMKVVALAVAATLPWMMKFATITILSLIVVMALFWLKAMVGV